MKHSFIPVVLLVYLFSTGLFFLIFLEGNYTTNLSGKILQAALFSLAPVIGVTFGYWWQNRKKEPFT